MRIDDDIKYRVVVGMATCGIAAGARPVLNTLVEEVAKSKLPVKVLQTGCIGMCTLEPIVEVYDQDDNKTTYVLVNSEKAKEIVDKHLIHGEVIDDYTVGKYKQ
ncbi:MAG: (2Fe-2S) ferredoxin domain-containing protein [Thomasclavelia sp.]|nr:(2Fe-2S) ferredoxin domain-containing protein [Thomasclavelia sp.]